jgi:hypothetical protein
MDKQLKGFPSQMKKCSHKIVSILGLMDKQLKVVLPAGSDPADGCFNPWFDG